MQAQVVGAALHVGRREGNAERFAQRGNVLEEDLFLKILRPGRNQHALAAENRRHQVGERLARAGAGFGEQDAAVLERARDGHRHRLLTAAGLEGGNVAGEGPAGREDGIDGGRQAAGRQACMSG